AYYCFFFFFQAEDGIRDRNVTGVQTCALPIFGLTSLLTDRDANIMDTVNYVADANIYILAAGPIPPNPSELLGSNRMAELIGELEEMFDLVIFDTPPILAVTDAQVVATRVDGVIVVVRSGIANKNEVRKTKDLLDVVNANV